MLKVLVIDRWEYWVIGVTRGWGFINKEPENILINYIRQEIFVSFS